jgi:hypothetical protein
MKVKVINYKDQVCLADSWTCADAFGFFSVFEQTHMPPDIDGVLGIGPSGSGGPQFV